MKKMAIVTVVVAALIAGTAFAQMGWGGGPGPGMGYGRGFYRQGATGNTNIENLKKFQKETLGLRDELITKRTELSNEYNKETPDTARIGELQKQIVDLQTKIQKTAEKNGLSAWGQGRGYGRAYGMGPGMMYGNGQYGCPYWQ
jgi:hypothetical protein